MSDVTTRSCSHRCSSLRRPSPAGIRVKKIFTHLSGNVSEFPAAFLNMVSC